MKQKIFSLLVLLVVAVTGAWADEVTIGDNTTTTTTYVTPTNSLWNYSFVEQIYTASEIGTSGTITSISFHQSSENGGNPSAVAIYMKHVNKETFGSTDDYETVSASDKVWEGTLTYLDGGGWITFTLDTPFEYNGTDNLLIACHETTSGYSTRYFYCTDKNNTVLSCHSDSAIPDPYNLGSYTGTKSVYSKRANIKINIGPAAASGYALTKADDAEVHGTVQFNIGEDEDLEEDVSSAEEGDKVTVIVTPEDGYMVAEVTGEWQAAIARAPHRAAVDMMRDIDLQFVSEDATTRAKTYTFEMIRANAEFSCTYKKLLTHPDITVEPIADIPYTSVPIEPEVVVKDGETTLVLGTDYTVTYVNNVEIGTATVIITAVESSNYSGSIQTTFEIITNRLVLETSIANAWNYYNSIKDTNPDVAAWLKEAIDAAQEVLDNEDASQRELGDAANVLNDAVIAAQTEVDAKRITITIPAKSYVARIDAVKRTIDEGVAGVALYSVKSVTDSEVELTAELGIVPEDTPYIIYNNNDEDVTISIVFTHDAPDDVTYDSEHFKGTLTDKAITDEDLQAADYYTLTEGLDFTKMQAAATVAANQCWIELAPASDAHASSLTIVPEGGTTPTGIADVQREATDNNVYYDLNGRRVAQPTKGLYILNGKKVLVK